MAAPIAGNKMTCTSVETAKVIEEGMVVCLLPYWLREHASNHDAVSGYTRGSLTRGTL